jgi:hypothetical protein
VLCPPVDDLIQPLHVMTYIDVTWFHKLPTVPVRLVSELDDERYEVRKLEFFADGSVGFAWREVLRRAPRSGVLKR